MENPIYFAQCEELHHQGATPLLGAGRPSQWCSNASLARRHLQIMLMTSCTLAIVLPHSLAAALSKWSTSCRLSAQNIVCSRLTWRREGGEEGEATC